MEDRLVLASGSATRRQLLENAGVLVDLSPARIDEEALRQAMAAEGISPRDMSDALAEAKTRKVAGKMPGRLVLGCDQILEHQGQALGKAADLDGLRAQMQRLRGQSHILWSAAVLYQNGQPVWRQIERADMHMVDFSDTYLDDYLARNGRAVLGCVGGYMLESEGARLFSRVDGSYFTVLGLPLLPVLQQLTRMGVLSQ
ncbi:MAG: Maf family protein [Mangrovicoccus sp.]|nr:Maf family protein [Mangrovicoccus sp.]